MEVRDHSFKILGSNFKVTYMMYLTILRSCIQPFHCELKKEGCLSVSERHMLISYFFVRVVRLIIYQTPYNEGNGASL